MEGTRELKLHVYYKSRLNFDEHLAQGKIEVRRNYVGGGPVSTAPRLQERGLKPSLRPWSHYTFGADTESFPV